jgi:hypothetical protein
MMTATKRDDINEKLLCDFTEKQNMQTSVCPGHQYDGKQAMTWFIFGFLSGKALMS